MKPILICIAICLISMPNLAQQNGSSKSESETNQTSKPNEKGKTGSGAAKTESDAEADGSPVRRRALDLLRQAGDEASNISDARQAARLQARVANLLWDHDREMAVKLFESAFDIAIRYYR